MITINDKNETYIQLDIDSEEDFRQVFDFFTIKIPGAEFIPSVKMGFSSGTKKFITPKGELPYGLTQKLIKFCEQNDIKVQDNRTLLTPEISFEQFKQFITLLDLPFTPYPHQIKGAYEIIANYRRILLSATGSGKSYLFYLVFRYMIFKQYKSMLIVPTIDLVNQMYTDFEEYFYANSNKLKKKLQECTDDIEKESIKSSLEDIYLKRKQTKCLSIEENFAKIFGGQDKHTSHICKISTYQSLSLSQDRVDPEYFQDLDAVIIDECVHPETKITMMNGDAKNIKDIQIGDKVLTINEKTKVIEADEVVKVYKNLSSEQMFELTLENNKIIKITGNHKVNTLNGWKRVDTLSLEDEIIDLDYKLF